MTYIILEKQHKQLLFFLESYNTKAVEKVYDELNIVRKQLVAPLDISIKERIRQWNEEQYKENDYYALNNLFQQIYTNIFNILQLHDIMVRMLK